MKKVEKGKPGYLNYKKKAEILRTVIYFAIVAAILDTPRRIPGSI